MKFDKEEKPKNEATDFLGNPLAVGDKVIFIASYYRYLQKGKIISINPKTVTVKDDATSIHKALNSRSIYKVK